MTAFPIDGASRRIVLASPMKSGSTYTARVLMKYLGITPIAPDYDWLAEQNLTHELLAQLADRPFVLGLHMRPHATNLRALAHGGMDAVVTWRNLADVIISFDDHAGRYGAHNPVFYVEQESYMRASARERYAYCIDRIVPWNLGFYLSWRRLPGRALYPYELMVDDATAYFAGILNACGIAREDHRLHAALSIDDEASRFNRGVVGRAAGLLDEDLKHALERYVITHPEFAQLEVLLWELPWEPLGIARVSEHDGTTVTAHEGEPPYFVSRGIRHAVTPSWLASRGTPALRTPRPIGTAGIAALEDGEALF